MAVITRTNHEWDDAVGNSPAPWYPPHDPALPVVMVDFDGVLASNTWPSPALGQADMDAVRLLEHYTAAGCEVHIFTARPESHWPRIWSWLGYHAIEHLIYGVGSTKRAACLYFDDKAHRWPL